MGFVPMKDLVPEPVNLNPIDEWVVLLGASPKRSRYSNQALRLLQAEGYRVIPVHPKAKAIEQTTVVNDLRSITEKVHTVTLYVGPSRSVSQIDAIIGLKPSRLIFNPGAESVEMERRLTEHDIPYVHGCTLVMLRTGQF